jgi:VPDSG-CTERM motif
MVPALHGKVFTPSCMKKFVTCALLALALALDAEAKENDNPDKAPAEKVPKDKENLSHHRRQRQGQGLDYSVPDAGSTAPLLGIAILALGVARRRLAIR